MLIAIGNGHAINLNKADGIKVAIQHLDTNETPSLHGRELHILPKITEIGFVGGPRSTCRQGQ